MKKITLTTAQLRSLCDQAEALKFCHGPNKRFWDDVDPEGTHVVDLWLEHCPILEMWKGIDHGFDFEHNGGLNIRACVVAQLKRRKKGDRATAYLVCDFDYDAFMRLLRDSACGTAKGARSRLPA